MTGFEYVGSELLMFREAINWKRYWSGVILPFLGMRVLDVGAGIGATAQAFAKHECSRWIELEPDPVQAREIVSLRDRGELPARCEVLVGTSRDLRAHDRFDTVLYIDVLEHIEDDRAELTRVLDHVDAGGHVVILAPADSFLFTDFDTSIGHFRRYDRRSLSALLPAGCDMMSCRYLDSAGMLASLANRLLLKQSMPSAGQIRFWDRVLVRCSLVLDRLTFGCIGKTVVCVYRKRDGVV
ncbi:MAG: class I SAM-dependent methyltransferase [Chitinophagaceae bacterium]